MAINPYREAESPPPGDYVVTRGSSTLEQIADATRTLSHQGCRRVRMEVLDDGRLVAHGYLREYA